MGKFSINSISGFGEENKKGKYNSGREIYAW